MIIEVERDVQRCYSIIYNSSKLEKYSPQMEKWNDFWQIYFVEIVYFFCFEIILMIGKIIRNDRKPTIKWEYI